MKLSTATESDETLYNLTCYSMSVQAQLSTPTESDENTLSVSSYFNTMLKHECTPQAAL